MQLTPQGTQLIEDVARRHGVSLDAAICMLQALNAGGGTMAQFSHPEFGGSGQWMQGGMTMVGDMFNNSLKAKVDNLCYELSGLLANQPLFAPPPPSPFQGGQGSAPSLFVSGGGQWWPAELGQPSSSGAQNELRYAIFPQARRLAIDLNGQLTIYDTLDHQIGGVGQQQGGGLASFTFSSQYGTVPVGSLPVVGGQAPPPPPPFESQGFTQGFPAPADGDSGDIFGKIEKLADLRQKGILTEGEFAAKKAELLARL